MTRGKFEPKPKIFYRRQLAFNAQSVFLFLMYHGQKLGLYTYIFCHANICGAKRKKPFVRVLRKSSPEHSGQLTPFVKSANTCQLFSS